LVERSFFLTQLERRNVHLARGPQAYLLAMFRVASLMKPLEDRECPEEDDLWELVQNGVYVDSNATLEEAMPVFERSDAAYLPVLSIAAEDQPPELWGALWYVDALKAYNRALAATAEEEHS